MRHFDRIHICALARPDGSHLVVGETYGSNYSLGTSRRVAGVLMPEIAPVHPKTRAHYNRRLRLGLTVPTWYREIVAQEASQ